jgi:hypothetical protein
MRACRLVLCAILAVLPLGACTSGPATPQDPPGASAPGLPSRPAFDLDAGSADLWLTFDDPDGDAGAARSFSDASGHGRTGEVESVSGGRVQPLPGPPGRGRAIAFPPACAAGDSCGRALVEVDDSAGLDPGSADFTFGVSVMLDRDQTATGSNLVQKGRFGTSGGQWKLQVDTLDGHPSCVVRGDAAMLSVRSPVTIADGRWHRVNCSKDAQGVVIEVDGEVRRKAGVVGAVANDFEVRVGSSGLGQDDDQFHGAVDDVVLRIE